MTQTTLQDRVIAYKCFELPGQPMYTHTGTSRLISDLYIAVEALTKERDALMSAAKLALESLVEIRYEGLSWDVVFGRAITTLRQAGVQ